MGRGKKWISIFSDVDLLMDLWAKRCCGAGVHSTYWYEGRVGGGGGGGGGERLGQHPKIKCKHTFRPF